MKIIIAVGARPNFVKVSPLIKEIKKHTKIEYLLVHTGQHYDKKMSDLFFENLDIPVPDVNLGIGAGSHAEQTAGVMVAFEKICLRENPDLVIVFGDVNSTLACALTAVKLNIKIAHIEAGLRSFNKSMPEEINRILTDHISDYLFATEQAGYDNLVKEGINKKKIFMVGNIMIDALSRIVKKNSDLINKLNLKNYCIVTLHRVSNVDDQETLKKILNFFDKISKNIAIVWPLHPRTKKKIKQFKIFGRLKKYHVIEPLGYLDFVALLRRAQFVLSDSGGVQTESTFLRVPCLTMREETEHLITISQGTNILVNIKSDIKKALAEIKKRKYQVPKYWDAKTAERIVNILLRINKEKI